MRNIGSLNRFAHLGIFTLLVSACDQNFDPQNTIPTSTDGTPLPGAPSSNGSTAETEGEAPVGDGEIITVVDSHNFTVEERAIDVLFVVDNSGSMSGEQTILTQSFEGFIQAFTQRYINARIGVTSTDMSGTSGVSYSNSNAYSNFIQKGPGGLIAKIETNASLTPKFLDTETMSINQIVSRFKQPGVEIITKATAKKASKLMKEKSNELEDMDEEELEVRETDSWRNCSKEGS
jgi:hypothetical protein